MFTNASASPWVDHHRVRPRRAGASELAPVDALDRRRAEVPPSRVRGMPPPLASNPHRFHEDRSEIAHDIAQVARIIAPRRVRRSAALEVSAERSGRAIIASQVINGKRVQGPAPATVRHSRRMRGETCAG
jgi:hypothetical protein